MNTKSSLRSSVLAALIPLCIASALLWLNAARAASERAAVPGATTFASQPADVTIEPVGHFGGWLAAIAVPAAGDPSPSSGQAIISLGEGSGFAVYDVTDKARPRHAASLPLDGEDVSGIALAGSTAYLVNGAGLRVVSLADPLRPALVGGIDLAGAVGIAVADGTAFVAAGQAGLLIVDVSTPLSPTLRGAYDTPGRAQTVQVIGATAYVADGPGGLQIINVSNPAAPALLGAYGTPAAAVDVQVAGNMAYVAYAGEWAGGLLILDVSNPASPVRRGAYEAPGQVGDVEVVGGVAYVAHGAGGLHVLDISNPASPTLLAAVQGGWRADLVKVSGSDAYVGIGPEAVVHDLAALRARVAYTIECYRQAALVEEFIIGREFNVSLWGDAPVLLPLAEINFHDFSDPFDRIVSFAAKWDATSFAYHHTPVLCPAPVEERLAGRIRATALAAWRVIGCQGYARVDMRVDEQEQPYVIEVNCNPDLSPEAGFFQAMRRVGCSYEEMVCRIAAMTLD